MSKAHKKAGASWLPMLGLAGAAVTNGPFSPTNDATNSNSNSRSRTTSTRLDTSCDLFPGADTSKAEVPGIVKNRASGVKLPVRRAATLYVRLAACIVESRSGCADDF